MPKSIHYFKFCQQSARLYLLSISSGLAPGANNILLLQGNTLKLILTGDF